MWSDILANEIIRTGLNIWQFLDWSDTMSDHFRKVIIPTAPGFDLVKDRCNCEWRLSELIDKKKVKKKTCDIDSETISRPGNAWIQPIWNHSKYLGFIWHPDCPLGYCKSTQDPIQLNFSDLSTSDSLCAKNHTGMLCGACKQNYSLTLHDYTCRECENKFLSLILFFAVSGIALIAVYCLCCV